MFRLVDKSRVLLRVPRIDHDDMQNSGRSPRPFFTSATTDRKMLRRRLAAATRESKPLGDMTGIVSREILLGTRSSDMGR